MDVNSTFQCKVKYRYKNKNKNLKSILDVGMSSDCVKISARNVIEFN